MKSLILMLQFFTRLPINIEIDVKEDSFTEGIKWFPFVGLVVGIIDAGVFVAAVKVLPITVAAVVTVLVNVLVTGALHYDGLADTCDGVFSARNRERMLEIMKDSRIGTNGALALGFDITLKILLITCLKAEYRITAIVAMTVVAKTMLALIIYFSKNHGKGSGLGSLFLGKIDVVSLGMSVGTGIIVAYVLLGWYSLVVVLVNLVVAWLYRQYMLFKLGVMTGDTMGALNEIVEIVTLLTIVILSGSVQ